MLYSIIKKEFLLVRRDVHAVMVLFVMPVAFILIMSLSLQDTFQQEEKDKPGVGLIFEQDADKDTAIGKLLTTISGFQLVKYINSNPRNIIINDELVAAILIPHDFITGFDAEKKSKQKKSLTPLQINYAPTTPESIRKLLYTSISLKLVVFQAETNMTRTKNKKSKKSDAAENDLIEEKELYEQQNRQPSSVEQTVPAWLIFSMFFVVIPISTTFLIEKQQGTLQRLKTMPVPGSYFLIGKLLPYLFINIVQTILMFLVGIYLLPLLGGQALHLSENAWLLAPMSIAVSIAAISFALLIATLVRTTEQATTIGGISNLLFGAIGGVMVPTFIMPEMMQNFARFSPMNWGLEGFLTIILRQGSFTEIVPEMVKLLLFGLTLFSLAIWFHRRTVVT